MAKGLKVLCDLYSTEYFGVEPIGFCTVLVRCSLENPDSEIRQVMYLAKEMESPSGHPVRFEQSAEIL